MAMTATPLRQADARDGRPRLGLGMRLRHAASARRSTPDEDIDLRWTRDRRRVRRTSLRRLDHAASKATRARPTRLLPRAAPARSSTARADARSASPMILDDDHRAVQDAVRAYVQDRIAPHAARWDRDSALPEGRAAGPGRARLLRRRGADRDGTAPASTTSRSPSSSRRSPPATARPRRSSASTTARSARS